MREIQSKQSPVEDLLRQADDLIANQKPRSEITLLSWVDVPMPKYKL
jgi:hypothetical protein